MELKGDQYKKISEIQKSVTAKLKAIPICEWKKATRQLKDCAKECIRATKECTRGTKECIRATKECTRGTKECIRATKECTRATKECIRANGDYFE